jgi:hypothetical protein
LSDGAPSTGARLADAAVAGTSRRGFLDRLSRGLMAVTGGAAVARAVEPGDAEAFHFCGHIYTTASCPHPTGIPRIDLHGHPLRAKDGHPVDDLGRLVDHRGRAVSEHGKLLRDPDGRPLPRAPRTRICLDGIPRAYHRRTHIDGSWYRCCGGHVRRLVDCCSYSTTRINGDASLTGYCYAGRRVFCVMYYQTKVPC